MELSDLAESSDTVDDEGSTSGSPDDGVAAFGRSEKCGRRTGTEELAVCGRERPVTSFAAVVESTRKLLVSGGMDNTVRIWELTLEK